MPVRRFVMILGVLVWVAIAPAAETDPLLSKAEAAKLIGQPVVGPKVMGPEKDDDAPAQATHWSYLAKDSMVVVTRLDFASAAEAKKYATPAFIKKQNDEDEAKVTDEPGVGDKAFWTVTEEGCALSFLKGSHIANVAVGGKNIGSPDSHKSALKAAAIAIAAKL